MFRKTLLFFLLAQAFLVCLARPAFAGEANQLVKLLDYIGSDYPGAVQDGKVLSESEFQEMLHMHQAAQERLELLIEGASDPEAAQLRAEIGQLGAEIQNKASSEKIAALTRDLREKAIARFRIRVSPQNAPSFDRGKTLFSENCAICHGARGNADTPIAQNFDPKPKNFLDPQTMQSLSPFQAFNVISFGVEGTAMPSFGVLSEDERWDLAFYVFTLRHAAAKSDSPSPQADLSWLADSTDGELIEHARKQAPAKEPASYLASLRCVSSYSKDMLDPFRIAEQNIQNSEVAFRSRDPRKAEDFLLSAYLDGIEKIEPQLRVKDAELVTRIEGQFQSLRASIGRPGQEEKFLAGIQQFRENLQTAKIVLERKNTSPIEAFWVSFLLIVREGIEAALIVAAILGLVRSTGERRAAIRVHWGWISALIAGALTWVVSQQLISISGASRELIEGSSALIAAAVLFYASYWLLSKVDVARWMKFIQSHVKSYLATGSLVALTGLSFLAVYREVFETVLFYQALVQGAPGAGLAILLGMAAGASVLGIFVWVMFRLQKKLPLRGFFLVSGILLYLLAFVLAGKGIWALQEGGFVKITSLSLPAFPWLGIYPSLEGVLVQSFFLVAVLVGGLILYLRRPRET